MDDFDKAVDDFDKQLDRHFRVMIVSLICGWTVGVTILAFASWVVFKLLVHFGVV